MERHTDEETQTERYTDGETHRQTHTETVKLNV